MQRRMLCRLIFSTSRSKFVIGVDGSILRRRHSRRLGLTSLARRSACQLAYAMLCSIFSAVEVGVSMYSREAPLTFCRSCHWIAAHSGRRLPELPGILPTPNCTRHLGVLVQCHEEYGRKRRRKLTPGRVEMRGSLDPGPQRIGGVASVDGMCPCMSALKMM